jgi:hypothetical protein
MIVELASGQRFRGPRLNQNLLLGAILCDPDDGGPTAACPGATYRHGGIRRESE